MIIVRLILLVLAIFTVAWGISEYQAYTRDKARLFTIAHNLGYAPDHYLDLRRSTSYGPDASYDTLTVLFTTKPIDHFSKDVTSLNFQPMFFFGNGEKNHLFLPLLNRMANTKQNVLSLGSYTGNRYEKFPGWDKLPQVFEWLLISPEGKQVDIWYAQTNAMNDTWQMMDKPISGNVVRIDYHRR